MNLPMAKHGVLKGDRLSAASPDLHRGTHPRTRLCGQARLRPFTLDLNNRNAQDVRVLLSVNGGLHSTFTVLGESMREVDRHSALRRRVHPPSMFRTILHSSMSPEAGAGH